MPDGQGFTLRDHATLEGVMRLAKFHGLVVMVHTSEPVGHEYPGKGEVKPEEVVRLAEEFPDVRMICAHWGGGLLFYELMPEVAKVLSNVYYDSAASSLLYDDAIYELATRIAPQKILFGTDYPLIGQRGMLTRIREKLNDSEHLEAFLHTNAERLLGIAGEERFRAPS
jgi:predicted TIM-barrel fold metal-dependent hydrolase